MRSFRIPPLQYCCVMGFDGVAPRNGRVTRSVKRAQLILTAPPELIQETVQILRTMWSRYQSSSSADECQPCWTGRKGKDQQQDFSDMDDSLLGNKPMQSAEEANSDPNVAPSDLGNPSILTGGEERGFFAFG